MPTLNISGMATTGKSFFVGFGLAPNEQQDSYQFVLNALRKAYLDLNLSRAETPITDNNNSPIKEIKVFSPAAHIALRIWHVNKNIFSKNKQVHTRELLLLLLLCQGLYQLESPEMGQYFMKSKVFFVCLSTSRQLITMIRYLREYGCWGPKAH